MRPPPATDGGGVDVLAVIRAPLEAYPPSLNQVRLLARHGLRVTVADLAPTLPAEDALAAEPGTARVSLGVQRALEGQDVALARRLCDHVRFGHGVRRLAARLRPAVVLAYDPAAIAAVRRPPGAALVAHFHELPLPATAGGGPLMRRAARLAARRAADADLVLFPDPARARIYAEATGLPRPPAVAFNCPLAVPDAALPADALRPRLAALGVPAEAPVVLFQGWIGPSRAIAETIRSMPLWPAAARFVLIGPVRGAQREALTALAAATGVARRVLFLGPLPYPALLAHTVGADVGLALVSPRHEAEPAWRYTAGAVNKRFEYMAAGIAQVASTGPGMAEIVATPGAGLLVDPDDPAAIGAAVARLLTRPEERREMAARARRAHLERFSYEAQFAPVLTRIEALAAARCPARHPLPPVIPRPA